MADTVTQDLFRQVQQLEQDLTIMAEGLARIGFALQSHMNECNRRWHLEQNGDATGEGMPEAPVPETGMTPAPFTGTPYDAGSEED